MQLQLQAHHVLSIIDELTLTNIAIDKEMSEDVTDDAHDRLEQRAHRNRLIIEALCKQFDVN